MNKTFYVPKDKVQLVEDFARICQEQGLNYSNVLVDAMEVFVKVNKGKKKGGAK